MSAEDAEFLAGMDAIVESGAEDRLNDVVEKVTGTPPQRFYDIAVREKKSWV